MPLREKLDARIEEEIRANAHHLSTLREIQKRIRVKRKPGRKIPRVR